MRNQSTVDDDQQGGSTKRSDFLGCVKREDANNKLKIYSSCFVYNTSVHAYVQECYLVGCRMIIFRKEKKAEIYALQAESRPIPTIFSARECGAFETRRRVRPHQKDLGPGHHNMDHVSHCWGWKEGVGPMLVLSTFFGTPMWYGIVCTSTYTFDPTTHYYYRNRSASLLPSPRSPTTIRQHEPCWCKDRESSFAATRRAPASFSCCRSTVVVTFVAVICSNPPILWYAQTATIGSAGPNSE